ncbi:uncharacterized protein FFE2_15851 [Fusarium fujikuroi]|nr:uncharacterized protein FFE2_15851 [Fusarium fujikuroi]SCO25689.1 uncharacterized protein FFC1_15662 [Fusarium fujikuroi]
MVVAATINDATLETSLNAERPAKEHAQGAKSKCKLLAAAVWKSTWINASQSDFPDMLSIDHFVSQTKGVNSKYQLVKSIKDMTCRFYANLIDRSYPHTINGLNRFKQLAIENLLPRLAYPIQISATVPRGKPWSYTTQCVHQEGHHSGLTSSLWARPNESCLSHGIRCDEPFDSCGIIINAIHGQYEYVLVKIDLELFAKIALIADYMIVARYNHLLDNLRLGSRPV